MGRYISGGGGNDQPRRKVLTLTSSNPSIPVPEWARGGKGIVRVTGCGAGASGGVDTAANKVVGGGSGALATRHQIVIPSGVLSLSAVIGAGGEPVTASEMVSGNLGGTTTLTVGPTILRLNGGGNGYRYSDGGIPTCGSGNAFVFAYPGTQFGEFGVSGSSRPAAGASSPASSLSFGANGGASQGGGFGSGGISPWGSPSFFRNDFPSHGDGPDGTGYGCGGGGALSVEGVAVSSGRGAPGFLTLEFIEGA